MADRLTLHKYSDRDAVLSDLAFTAPTIGRGARRVPLESIFELLNSLGCQAIIKQFPVQDPDFYAEYNRYYSKVFGHDGKYCHRLHFFSSPPQDGEDALDFIDRLHHADESNYLGFVTIRPIRSSPVAASILKPPSGSHFILASDKFDIHLAGRTFRINGTPFMQQDNAVGACAQASIWMALRTLRKKEGNSAFDPAQITSAATRFLARGRTLPNREGLSVEQIVEAVRFAGYSSHILWLKEPGGAVPNWHQLADAKRKIYTYVESEIPVILGVYPDIYSGHALVSIGHNWNSAADVTPVENWKISDDTQLDIYHSVGWVNDFFVHNDNSGPYLKLTDRVDANVYALEQAAFAIPLLPSDVFITGEEAEVTSFDLIKRLVLPIFEGKNIKPQPLVLRTYLSERYKFREWVTGNTQMSDGLKRYYRQKVFPKRIWITEICLFEGYCDSHNSKSIRVGEVILDPTGEPDDIPFLSAHINLAAIQGEVGAGICFDRSSDGKKIEAMPIENDATYPALCRY